MLTARDLSRATFAANSTIIRVYRGMYDTFSPTFGSLAVKGHRERITGRCVEDTLHTYSENRSTAPSLKERIIMETAETRAQYGEEPGGCRCTAPTRFSLLCVLMGQINEPSIAGKCACRTYEIRSQNAKWRESSLQVYPARSYPVLLIYLGGSVNHRSSLQGKSSTLALLLYGSYLLFTTRGFSEGWIDPVDEKSRVTPFSHDGSF